MFRNGPIAVMAAVLLMGTAAAQSVTLQSSVSIIPAAFDMTRHHMGPNGKQCLSLSSSAKAQAVNKHIYEHWVGAANSCGQLIKVQVCYYKSNDCIIMDVPAFGRKDAVLGIYPALQGFRYEAKEQF